MPKVYDTVYWRKFGDCKPFECPEGWEEVVPILYGAEYWMLIEKEETP